jgi:chromosome segregation ATPase
LDEKSKKISSLQKEGSNHFLHASEIENEIKAKDNSQLKNFGKDYQLLEFKLKNLEKEYQQLTLLLNHNSKEVEKLKNEKSAALFQLSDFENKLKLKCKETEKLNSQSKNLKIFVMHLTVR